MARGRARMAMAQRMSLWVLEAPEGFGDADFHAHHAIQLTFCLRGGLSLESGGGSLTAPAIAVAADARHRFDAHGLLVFMFVEPESRAGRALASGLLAGADLAAIADAEFLRLLQPLGTTFDDDLPREALLEIGRAALDRLVPHAQPQMPDARVQRIIEFAASHLDQPLDLATASQGVYLSPSRLRHLFVEQTGLAFKTYLLWLRLVRAVQLYSEGANLTEAALAAGFSDSAHFSRIFKRTFGLPATTLTRL